VHTTKSVPKIEVYEALHGLNQSVEQLIRSLTVLQRAGLDLPFINGQKTLMEALRTEANQKILGVLTEQERQDWASFQKKRVNDSPRGPALVPADDGR
jgi:hypothetical protein